MAGFVEGMSRDQATLFPERLDDLISADAPVRAVDAFVDNARFAGDGVHEGGAAVDWSTTL
jgi:hypothetical protein